MYLIIKNGTIISPGATYEVDMVVTSGKIIAIGKIFLKKEKL